MTNSDQASIPVNEPSGLRALRVTGWLLMVVGFVSALGDILLAWFTVFSWDCWWFSTAIALTVLFRSNPLRIWCRLASASMVLFWFVSRSTVLQFVAADSAAQLGQRHLGLMLMFLGGLLVFTNDPHRRTRQFVGSTALMLQSHCQAIALLCVSALIIANPAHSHFACVRISILCERQGAYDAATVFARLARDTFPPPSFCGTCFAGMRQELSSRIARIEAKRDGVLPPEIFGTITPDAASTAVTAQPRLQSEVHSVSLKRPTTRERSAASPSP